jgi:hypothetical protein
MQMQVYAVQSGRGYMATATASVARFEDVRIALGNILHTLVIDQEAADASMRNATALTDIQS